MGRCPGRSEHDRAVFRGLVVAVIAAGALSLMGFGARDSLMVMRALGAYLVPGIQSPCLNPSDGSGVSATRGRVSGDTGHERRATGGDSLFIGDKDQGEWNLVAEANMGFHIDIKQDEHCSRVVGRYSVADGLIRLFPEAAFAQRPYVGGELIERIGEPGRRVSVRNLGVLGSDFAVVHINGSSRLVTADTLGKELLRRVRVHDTAVVQQAEGSLETRRFPDGISVPAADPRWLTLRTWHPAWYPSEVVGRVVETGGNREVLLRVWEGVLAPGMWVVTRGPGGRQFACVAVSRFKDGFASGRWFYNELRPPREGDSLAAGAP